MIVLARSGSDVRTVLQEMNSVYGSDSFGIVSPAAIIQAQKHTQAGGASFTLKVGFIAMLVSAVGVVTTLYTSVNERKKEIGTMKAKVQNLYSLCRCFKVMPYSLVLSEQV